MKSKQQYQVFNNAHLGSDAQKTLTGSSSLMTAYTHWFAACPGKQHWKAMPECSAVHAATDADAGAYRLGLVLLDGVGIEGIKSNGQVPEAPPLQAGCHLLLHLPLIRQAVLPLEEGFGQCLHIRTDRLEQDLLACVRRLWSHCQTAWQLERDICHALS